MPVLGGGPGHSRTSNFSMLLYREQVSSLITHRREVKAREKTWKEEGAYERLLRDLFPHGKEENGSFRISSTGEEGRRMSFVLESGMWSDFADQEPRYGLVTFMWELEGWDGLCRLARSTSLDFDWVILRGGEPREEGIYKFATKRGFIVSKKWNYVDLDGQLLGIRVRFDSQPDHDGKIDKEFRLLAYRTRKVTKDPQGNLREHAEGWRLDGGWGPIAPLYISPEDAASDKPILLLEGEKATDAAKALVGDEFACATWGSGSSGSPKRCFWEPIQERPKFMWPDKDTPGRKCANKICEIDKKTRVVQVWGLPDLSEGDDLADVDLSKRQWVLDLLKDAPYGITPAHDIVGRRYIYVTTSEMFIDVNSGTRYGPMAVRRAHKHEVDQLDEELLSDPSLEKVETITYWPGQDQFVMEANESGVPVRKYNVWKDGGCESIYGTPEVFLEHMTHLIPDEVVRNHVFNWMACIVQKLGTKINWAPLLKGSQGVGKSYLLRVCRSILGAGNVREITTRDLIGSFNSWAEGSSIVFIEEIMAIGRREITNELKPLITSPTIEINTKNVRTYTIPNRTNFFLFSNEEVPLILEEDDRRFLVYDSPMIKGDDSYYERLFSDLEENGGDGLIRGWLERRDISEFNPKSPAPMTESKKAMLINSESPVLSLMREYVQARRTPFDRDTVDQLDVIDWVGGQRTVRPGESNPRTVIKYLMKCGARPAGILSDGGEEKKMFVLRNHENYGS